MRDLQHRIDRSFLVQQEVVSVALNSAEVEYMAASQVACEVIWMRKVLVGFFGSHLILQ